MEIKNSIIKTSRAEVQNPDSERRKIRFSSPKSTKSPTNLRRDSVLKEKMTIQTFRKDKPEQIAKDVLTMCNIFKGEHGNMIKKGTGKLASTAYNNFSNVHQTL